MSFQSWSHLRLDPKNFVSATSILSWPDRESENIFKPFSFPLYVGLPVSFLYPHLLTLTPYHTHTHTLTHTHTHSHTHTHTLCPASKKHPTVFLNDSTLSGTRKFIWDPKKLFKKVSQEKFSRYLLFLSAASEESLYCKYYSQGIVVFLVNNAHVDSKLLTDYYWISRCQNGKV